MSNGTDSNKWEPLQIDLIWHSTAHVYLPFVIFSIDVLHIADSKG